MRAIRLSLAGLLGAVLLLAPVPALAQTAGAIGQQIPAGAIAVECSATGTTAATACSLAASAVPNVKTYICGFSIRANATAAATGNATVAGLSATLNFTQWTAPLASGLGITEPSFGNYCYPASAADAAITTTSAAPGSGGIVSVSAWGFQK